MTVIQADKRVVHRSLSGTYRCLANHLLDPLQGNVWSLEVLPLVKTREFTLSVIVHQ